jgi:translocation and assembly module TamA
MSRLQTPRHKPVRTRPTARRAAALSLVLLVLGLWSTEPRAADPQPYAVEFKPTGNKPLDAAIQDSSALVSLKDKAPVGGFALVQRANADKGRFEEALQAFGFYKATVMVTIGKSPLDDPTLVDTIDKAPAAPPLPVAVTIDPGPIFHYGQITIAGALPPNFKPPLSIIHGQPALAAEVLAAQEKLLGALRDESYPQAKVILLPATLHRDQNELDVSFQVTIGPRANLGEIQFTGLKDMKADFVRRRLLLKPGQPFSPTKIEAARQDLLSVGVFSSVRIVPAEQLDAAGNLPLTVEFQERPLHAVDLGAAWSTDLGASLNAGWHHRNLFGEGEQLNITGAVQLGGNATTKPGEQLGVQFLKPDFLRRDQTLDTSVNFVKQSLIAYDQTALIERAGITRKLSPEWTIGIGVLAEQEQITQEDVERNYNFVGLPLTVKYDTTTSLFDPVSGLRANLSVTPYQSLGNPGSTYFITQLSASTYFDFGSSGRSVLAMRGLIAQVSGAGVFGLPPDQRLYAGGSGTVRGYRYQSIGPQFADEKPTGGTAMSAGSLEFRQRFLESFGVAAFVDAGQASANAKPFTNDWRIGAGAGLRYYTPIGPIRLDFAIPLVKQTGSDSFEVYIGIGQAF